METAYISNPSNLLSIDINKINHTLKSLSVSGSKLSNINGLEKYQALETLSISNGYISNFKEIVDSVPANLKYLSIIDQEVKSNNTFEPNIPYTLNDVILPETSNSQISITTPNGSYIDNNLIFKDMAISLYHLRYECEKDGRNYNFSVKVNNVKPKGYNPSQWIKTFGSSFTESFLRDKTEFKVTLNANVTDVAVDSLFANKFTVNNKDYTYSYALGSNNSSKVYATYGNPNSRTYNISLRGNHITSYIKTENKKSYLKTVTEFIIDDLVFEKEEIAYVEDDGIRHDVKYTNKSGKKVEGIEFHQMLDTMLNENDSIPIYADGKGNAYIVSPDFTLFLELVNNDGELIVAPYGVGPKSTDGKAAKEYKRGDTLLIDTDTAVYYGLGKKDFDIDQSYSYSFKETIYTEIPEIKTVDKKIKVSSSWDPMDHLIGVYNEKGEDLDRSKLEIVHNTDPNVAGEYEITFIYNKVYSKKAKLTVLEEAVPPADEEKEPKADDNPKVKKEEKIKAKRVKTNDETNVALFISLILLSSLGLVGLRKKLNK